VWFSPRCCCQVVGIKRQLLTRRYQSLKYSYPHTPNSFRFNFWASWPRSLSSYSYLCALLLSLFSRLFLSSFLSFFHSFFVWKRNNSVWNVIFCATNRKTICNRARCWCCIHEKEFKGPIAQQATLFSPSNWWTALRCSALLSSTRSTLFRRRNRLYNIRKDVHQPPSRLTAHSPTPHYHQLKGFKSEQ